MLISFGSIADFLMSCAAAFVFGLFMGAGWGVWSLPYPWRR